MNITNSEIGKRAKKVISLGVMSIVCTASVFSLGIFGRKSGTNTKTISSSENNIVSDSKNTTNITVVCNGEEKNYKVSEGTVESALKFLNLDINSEDEINVDLNASVSEGMKIVVDKVKYEQNTFTETIPYETVYMSSTLSKQSTVPMSTNGKNGQRKITCKQKLVNDKVVSSEILNNEIIAEPVNKIVVEKNNNKKVKSEKKSNPVNNSKRVLTGSATAYTSNGNTLTSTGKKPTQGVTVAVNPNKIPYGTRLCIKSTDGNFQWNGVAQDTGAALKKGTALVDIYMNSKQDCLNFGRQQVNVYFK